MATTRLITTLLLFLLGLSSLHAQLDVEITSERRTFLLYEPIILEVKIKNTSGADIELKNEDTRSWLTFIVTQNDDKKVSEDIPFTLPEHNLAKGQSLSIPVDITPWYSIRETGPYLVRAVVKIPGGSTFMTDPLMLTVGIGNIVWSKKHEAKHEERTYELIQFMESGKTKLYLRVEAPEKNTVYSTTALGSFNSSLALDESLWDEKNILHILHPLNEKEYLYTQADSEGKILSQQSLPIGARFIQNNSGQVQVQAAAR